jgi:hypothetical protein
MQPSEVKPGIEVQKCDSEGRVKPTIYTVLEIDEYGIVTYTVKGGKTWEAHASWLIPASRPVEQPKGYTLKRVPVEETVAIRRCNFVPKNAFAVMVNGEVIAYIRGRPWVAINPTGGYIEIERIFGNKDEIANAVYDWWLKSRTQPSRMDLEGEDHGVVG